MCFAATVQVLSAACPNFWLSGRSAGIRAGIRVGGRRGLADGRLPRFHVAEAHGK